MSGTDVFFCDAHSPWQRGSNEKMNGLLRDSFPKGTDLSVHTVEDVAGIAAEIHNRPRKTLTDRPNGRVLLRSQRAFRSHGEPSELDQPRLL